MRALVVLIFFAVFALFTAHALDGRVPAGAHNNTNNVVHTAGANTATRAAPVPVHHVATALLLDDSSAPSAQPISAGAMAFLHALDAQTGLQPGQVKTSGHACWSIVQPPDGQACPQRDDASCSGTPLQIGACMAARRGWFDGPGTGNEWTCIVQIGDEESHWDPLARSPIGAYGIPQALPGAKMAQAGPDWSTNPRTQLQWMYDDYLVPTYGTPCGAQGFHAAHGWW
jgi:hypothetical protein